MRRLTTITEEQARVLALRALVARKILFVVSGAYAFFEHTQTSRPTKDLDISLRQADLPRAFEALQAAGFRTEVHDPVWLGKAYAGVHYVDLIFGSGNGLAQVDELWFYHAKPATVMGERCLIAPAEELIWSKAFVNERDRYDGADVNHLIYACGQALDWERLLWRFGRHWEVLFAHLILYRFAYPSERSKVPTWLIDELCRRTQSASVDGAERVCRGHLISERQYRIDYEAFGFRQDGERASGWRDEAQAERLR